MKANYLLVVCISAHIISIRALLGDGQDGHEGGEDGPAKLQAMVGSYSAKLKDTIALIKENKLNSTDKLEEMNKIVKGISTLIKTDPILSQLAGIKEVGAKLESLTSALSLPGADVVTKLKDVFALLGKVKSKVPIQSK